MRGNYRYHAPEQFDRPPKGLFPKDTDMYSLGAILYEMIMETVPSEAFKSEAI